MGTLDNGVYIYRDSPRLLALNAEIRADRDARERAGLLPHGTRAAYRRHRARGEVPCEACAMAAGEANARYWARWRQARKTVQNTRPAAL